MALRGKLAMLYLVTLFAVVWLCFVVYYGIQLSSLGGHVNWDNEPRRPAEYSTTVTVDFPDIDNKNAHASNLRHDLPTREIHGCEWLKKLLKNPVPVPGRGRCPNQVKEILMVMSFGSRALSCTPKCQKRAKRS